MAENRLPIVDGDDGVWGEIVNQFIEKEHYNTGTDNAANGGHKTITIRPGTTGAGTAPLKFTSGPLMTSSEVGAMEFNNDKLHFTVTTGAVRKTIALYDDTSGATGDIYYRSSGGEFTRLAAGSNGDFLKVASGLPSWGTGVTSVNGDSGVVTLDKSDIGLSDVDNTSDLDKPLSTQAQYVAYASQQKKFYPQLRGWNAAVAGRATTAARVVMIGDSITHLNCVEMARRINSMYNPYANTHFYRAGGTYGGTWGGLTGTFTGTLDTNHGLGSYGGTLTGSQEGTLIAACDGFILSYDVQQSGGGDMEIYIDNVLITTINTTDGAISGSTESGRLWTSAALTYGNHTLKVKINGGGSVKIGGGFFTAGNRTTGVQVWNAAHTGWNTANFIADESTYEATKTLDPDLIVLNLGTNDHGAGLATFETNLTAMVQRLKADTPLASIMLVAPYASLDRSDWPDFVDVVKSVAVSEDVAFFDMYAAMGQIGAAGDVYDLSGDNVHPSAKGGDLMSSALVDSITSPVAHNDSPYLKADGSVNITGALVLNLGSNGTMGFGAVFGAPMFVSARAHGDANFDFVMYGGVIGAALGYPGYTMAFGAGGASAYDTAFFRSAASEMTIGAGSPSTLGNIKTSLLRNNAGSPETVVAAPVGAIAQDTTNGVVYVKKTGTGNTGWQRVPSASLDVSTKTATTYTITSSDTVIIADATSNVVTITLPLASAHAGYRFYVKRKDNSGNAVTIARTGSDTIDGATSQTLDSQYTSATIVSDGTNWYIL